MSERRPGPSVRVRVTEHRDSGERHREDRLVTEEPLELRLAWPGRAAERAWITMRTPGHDFELAAGWVVHEGIAPGEGIRSVAYCTDAALAPDQEFNVVTVTLAAPPAGSPPPARQRHRRLVGVRGVRPRQRGRRARLARGALGGPAARRRRRTPPARRAARAPAALERTGGVHAAGLASAEGDLLVVREDVGRHNAVDKVTGARVLAGEATAQACLVVSGRAGFELVQKALAAGIGSLAAVGAPTSLAASLAREGGLALFGFVAEDRAVQYA